MVLDTCVILFAARKAARRRSEPHHAHWRGDDWCHARRAWEPIAVYRVLFAEALRGAWRDAKDVARHAALEATAPIIPPRRAARCHALLTAASAVAA